MGRRIVIIQGHPDPQGGHLDHALASAYAEGANQAGHEVRTIEIARLNFPLLRSKQEWDAETANVAIRESQQTIAWAEHLVILYPLWLGAMPALLKGFLEQVLRPGFAVAPPKSGLNFKTMLAGRSARIVVTMGMPAFVYRWYFGAHSLKSLERNILKFVGISPIRCSIYGIVEGSAKRRAGWLAEMRKLGTKAA